MKELQILQKSILEALYVSCKCSSLYTQYRRSDSICLPVMAICEEIDSKPSGCLGGTLWPVIASNRSRNPEQNREKDIYPRPILGLHSANERRRYFVTTSLIGWAQT